jgi:hypothetical protein
MDEGDGDGVGDGESTAAGVGVENGTTKDELQTALRTTVLSIT